MSAEHSELDNLLNVIRVWMKTESGPTMSKFSHPNLQVQVTIRGYKRLTLERTFPKVEKGGKR